MERTSGIFFKIICICDDVIRKWMYYCFGCCWEEEVSDQEILHGEQSERNHLPQKIIISIPLQPGGVNSLYLKFWLIRIHSSKHSRSTTLDCKDIRCKCIQFL